MKEINFSDYGYHYGDLIESFEVNVLLSKEYGDYRGDYYILMEKDGRYGFLVVGYGSCSGCDSLLACNTNQEITELRDSLYNDIDWHDSAIEMYTRFATADWRGKYWWYNGSNKFVELSMNKLHKIIVDDVMNNDNKW